VRKGKNGFQIVNGFRDSWTGWDDNRSGLGTSLDRTASVPDSPLGSFGANDIANALIAMEHRVSGLMEDRRRLGRDLHDCILQSLYAIGLNLEVSRHPSTHQSTESPQPHDQLVGQLNRLIREVRAMIESLESDTIQDFDMAGELMSLQTTYEQAGRLHIQLDLDRSALASLTMEEQTDLLNIIREALSNCVRHADAGHVVVAIRKRGSGIRVSIADDGRGFTLGDDCRRGYGLTNMDARARKLGGVLRVKPTNGRGTTVSVDLSLSSILTPI
jgi:signal transduction histidine kinase